MTSFQYLVSTTIPLGKTGSRPITEVKSGLAKLVLGWVTAWEYFVL